MSRHGDFVQAQRPDSEIMYPFDPFDVEHDIHNLLEVDALRKGFHEHHYGVFDDGEGRYQHKNGKYEGAYRIYYHPISL